VAPQFKTKTFMKKSINDSKIEETYCKTTVEEIKTRMNYACPTKSLIKGI
jgi:hypothetical protein